MANSKIYCSKSKITAIADAIREKSGSTDTLTLDEMPTSISGLKTAQKNAQSPTYIEPIDPKEYRTANRPSTWPTVALPSEMDGRNDRVEFLYAKNDSNMLFWSITLRCTSGTTLDIIKYKDTEIVSQETRIPYSLCKYGSADSYGAKWCYPYRYNNSSNRFYYGGTFEIYTSEDSDWGDWNYILVRVHDGTVYSCYPDAFYFNPQNGSSTTYTFATNPYLVEISGRCKGCSVSSIVNNPSNTSYTAKLPSLRYFSFTGMSTSSFPGLGCAYWNSNGTMSSGYSNSSYWTCINLEAVVELGFNNLTNASGMFYGCKNLVAVPLSMNFGNCNATQYMFYNCTSLRTIPQYDWSKIDTMSGCFSGSGIEYVPDLNLEYCQEVDYTGTKILALSDFNYNLPSVTSLNMGKVTNASNELINKLTTLTSLGGNWISFDDNDVTLTLPNLTSASVIAVQNLLQYQNKLSLDLSQTKITSLQYLCNGSYNTACYYDIDEINLKVPETITTMAYAFSNMRYLKKVRINWENTSNLTSISYMFNNCMNLETVTDDDVLSASFPKLTNMQYAFYSCSKLTNSIELKDLVSFINSGNSYGSSFCNGCNKIKSVHLTGLSSVQYLPTIQSNSKLEVVNVEGTTSALKTVQIISNDSLKEINISDTSGMTSMSFTANTSLEKFDLDTSKVTSFNGVFSYSFKDGADVTVDFLSRTGNYAYDMFSNMGQEYINSNRYTRMPNINLHIKNLYGNLQLSGGYVFISHDNIVNIFKELNTLTSGTTYTIYVDTSLCGALTDEEKAIATNKGWTVSESRAYVEA